MPVMKGLLAPQNTFLDTIATRFDGTRKYNGNLSKVKIVASCGLVGKVTDHVIAVSPV